MNIPEFVPKLLWVCAVLILQIFFCVVSANWLKRKFPNSGLWIYLLVVVPAAVVLSLGLQMAFNMIPPLR